MKLRCLLFLLPVLLLMSCGTSKVPSSSNHLTEDNKKTSESLSPSKKASNVIEAARKYLGTPYKYSGTDKNGIDCSGLMCRSFSEIGITLPHQSEEQSRLGKPLKLNELKPGDLVFIGAKKGSNKITHVGLVVSVANGKVMFIHASTKRGVIEENLLEKWYQPLFIKGVRLF